MDAEKRGLIEENRWLRARVGELERTVRDLQEQVQVFWAALEEARRAGKRQAAPFRKGKIVQQPKRPGRKPGKDYGEHARRLAPEEAPSDERHEARLPAACPKCGSPRLEEDQPASEQFQTEIVCRTVRRRFVIHRGRCRDCGAAVRGRHPRQTSAATGAAASSRQFPTVKPNRRKKAALCFP
jgi:transposase